MTCPAFHNPASCENHAVTCFLHAKIMNAAEVQPQIWEAVYGQTVVSEGTVRQWCRMFRDWQSKEMFTLKSVVIGHI
jgi:hypothetical protein